MKRILIRLVSPVVRLYWRIARPKTHGVKAILTHPTDSWHVLLVLHTYGPEDGWNLPGGGYNPRKESAVAATHRELREELRTDCEELSPLGDYYTESEGKRDHVCIFAGKAKSADFSPGAEIRSYRWVDARDLPLNKKLFRIVRHASKLFVDSRPPPNAEAAGIPPRESPGSTAPSP